MDNSRRKTLEVPYAFGKLDVYEIRDPITNDPSGIFSITDQEHGFSFGVLNIAEGQNLHTSLANFNNLTNQNQNFMENLSSVQQIQTNTASLTLKDSEENPQIPFKLNNMMKQKKENDYLVNSTPQLNKRNSFENLENENSNDNKDYDKNDSNKKQKTDENQLHAFKLQLENLNLPYSAMQWGSLNFYSGKNLIYTHYLWGNDPIDINKDTLLNIKTPAKFGGPNQFTTESLADDFRLVLANGFKLTKNKDNNMIDFQINPNEKEQKNVLKNKYKIFIEANTDIIIDNENPQCIYDEKMIENLMHQDVKSMDNAIKFSKCLSVGIVLHTQLMNSMGISMERIGREDLRSMPYYMVLKFHEGYDSLNKYTQKMLTRYLTKKNSFFGQVYNVDPNLNLKTAN